MNENEDGRKIQEVLDRLTGKVRCRVCGATFDWLKETDNSDFICNECAWRHDRNPGANKTMFGREY